MIYTLLGKKGFYFYKGLAKRKSGATAANTKGRANIIMVMPLAGSL